MGLHSRETTETGIAVAIQLLGIGKAAFDHLPPPFRDPPTPVAQPALVDPFPIVFPDMADRNFLLVAATGALIEQRAVLAD